MMEYRLEYECQYGAIFHKYIDVKTNKELTMEQIKSGEWKEVKNNDVE